MPIAHSKSKKKNYKVRSLVKSAYWSEIVQKKTNKSSKKLCLIIKPGTLAKKLIQKKQFNQSYNYNFWHNQLDNQLIKYLKKNNYDYIIIDEINESDNVDSLVTSATFHDIDANKIYSINSFFQKKIAAVSFIYNNELEDEAHLYIKNPTNNVLALKRLLDIMLCLCVLPLALPLALLGIITTKLSSKGPAIFTQKRVGQYGEIFTIYKIRTMTHGKNNDGSFTVKGDARITKLGNILRKTKIDELPQIWNVLLGQMSWVGPRPERADIVNYYEKHNQFYKYRHLVKPGITGWAQVKFPTATPNENLEKLEYDLYYINHINIGFDVKILLKTFGIVSTLESL